MGSAVILTVVIVLMWSCSAGTPESRRSRRSSGDQNLPGGSYLRLPVALHSRNPLVPAEYFSPTRGTGSEPLPPAVRTLLLPVSPALPPPPPPPPQTPDALEPRGVDTHCDADQMRVRVQKSVLGSGGSASHLSLGTCGPTRSPGESIYFEIGLDQCRTVRTMINNRLVYSNTLRYDPPEPPGLIRRTAPFTLPVSCHYDRYQYSYKVGYVPKMETQGVVFKPMTSRTDFILTPRNARWERLRPWDHYVLGKPMFFEVEAGGLTAPDQRLYAQSCHATLGPSPTSTPRLTIVDNFGCMVKHGRARFIRSRNNRVRFTVDAFLLEARGQHLYMHCFMSTADSTATPRAKACNYNSASARWKEVSGLESVCSCCETSCSSAPSSDATVVSSRSWTVERRGKPSTPPKRKINMTTTMTPTTVGMRTKLKTSQQETTAVSPVEVDTPEWEWSVKVPKGSGVDSKVLKGSGGVKEVLKGSDGVWKVLKSSGGVKEILKIFDVVKEVLKAPETVREVLKGSEGEAGVLKVSSGVEDVLKGSSVDGKVMTGSEGVEEVLEGSGVVGKHVKGLAVEPRRIFEDVFGLNK